MIKIKKNEMGRYVGSTGRQKHATFWLESVKERDHMKN
jgi:hypothetical protein